MRAPIIGGHRRAYRPHMPARLPAAPTWRRTLAALLLALVPRSNRFMAGLSFKAMLAAMQLADSGLAGDPFEESGPDDYPVWQCLDTEREPPSVANLSRDLTINGTTVSPTFWYKGEDAGGTTWPAEVGGAAGLLTETGTGASPSYSQGSPLMGSDESVKGEGGKYMSLAGTSLGDVGNDDFVIEAVIKKVAGASARVFGKRAADAGWWAYVTNAPAVSIQVDDGTNPPLAVSATVSNDIWIHVLFVCDKSGFISIQVNGGAVGATDISGLGSFSNSEAAYGMQFTGNVAQFAMWKAPSGWLDSHDQSALGAERFRALTGTRPQIAAGSSVPNTMSRNSVAYIEKYNTSTSETELYKVGPHWPKIWRRKDKNGVVGIYYWPETAATNLQVWSEDLTNVLWTKARCSITNTSTTTLPNGETSSFDVLHEDGTAADTHYIYDANNVVAANKYVYSAWFEAINRNWLRLQVTRTTGGNVQCYFDVTNGVVGATPANTDNQGMEPWRGGWHCWISFTANDTEAAFCAPFISDADSGGAFDGLDQDSLFCWGVKLEEGTYPSSYITTGAAAATRLKDEMQFPGSANVGGVGSEKQGAMVCDCLLPDYDRATAGYFLALTDGGSVNESILLTNEGSGVVDSLQAVARVGGVVQYSITGATDLTDDVGHTIAHTWKANRAEAYIDGAIFGIPDTSCDIPDEIDRIDIGQSHTAVSQLNGGIRNIRLYRRYQHGTRWAA